MLLFLQHVYLAGLLLSGAIIAPDTTRDTREEGNIPCFGDRLGYLLVINVFLLVEHYLFIFYTHTDISELLAFGLIVYHAGSCCIIVIVWQTQYKENTVPSDATGDARSESYGVPNCNPVRLIRHLLLSPCIRLYNLITSEPLQGTYYLVGIMVFLDITKILDRLLPPTEYRNCLTMVFLLFTSFTYAVANYYIWKFLTRSAAHATVPVKGRWWKMLIFSFLVMIAFLGVAEIGCTVIHQTTKNLALNTSLVVAGCMNAALVIHEG